MQQSSQQYNQKLKELMLAYETSSKDVSSTRRQFSHNEQLSLSKHQFSTKSDHKLSYHQEPLPKNLKHSGTQNRKDTSILTQSLTPLSLKQARDHPIEVDQLKKTLSFEGKSEDGEDGFVVLPEVILEKP